MILHFENAISYSVMWRENKRHERKNQRDENITDI